VDGQKAMLSRCILEESKFEQFAIRVDDLLIAAEIADVEESWKEIREGRAKRFRTIEELLEELRR
jgi:hypothetical protein